MLRSSALLLALATALAAAQPARAGFTWVLPVTTSGEGETFAAIPFPGYGVATFDAEMKAEVSASEENQGYDSLTKTFTFLATFELSGSPGGWEILHAIDFEAQIDRSSHSSAEVIGQQELITGTDGAVLDSLSWAYSHWTGPNTEYKSNYARLTLPDGTYSLRGRMQAHAEMGWLDGGTPGYHAMGRLTFRNEFQFRPVPEPGSIAMAILGGSILLGGRAISGRRRDRPDGADAPPSGTSSRGGRSGRR